MNKVLKLVVALTLFTAIATASLAFTYEITSKVAEKNQERELQASLKEVYPEGVSFEKASFALKSKDPKIEFLDTFLAKDEKGNIKGAVVKTKGPGYGGPVTLLAGVTKKGIVTGVKILESTETPGLGANALNSKYYVNKEKKLTFLGQFIGKSIKDPFKAKEDIIAITSATITSNYVASLVKESIEAVMPELEKGGN